MPYQKTWKRIILHLKHRLCISTCVQLGHQGQGQHPVSDDSLSWFLINRQTGHGCCLRTTSSNRWPILFCMYCTLKYVTQEVPDFSVQAFCLKTQCRSQYPDRTVFSERAKLIFGHFGRNYSDCFGVLVRFISVQSSSKWQKTLKPKPKPLVQSSLLVRSVFC